MKINHKSGTLVIILVIGTFVVVGLLAFWHHAPGSVSVTKTNFDSYKWRIGNELERGAMVQDLVESKILLGKSKEEIIGLLGKSESDDTTKVVYRVDLGYRFGSSPWLYSVKVEFDSTTQWAVAVYYSD